jgi:hypothetical protein
MKSEVRQEIRVCNCAGCGREQVSRQDAPFIPRSQWRKRLLYKRIKDRPYCVDCVEVMSETQDKKAS